MVSPTSKNVSGSAHATDNCKQREACIVDYQCSWFLVAALNAERTWDLEQKRKWGLRGNGGVLSFEVMATISRIHSVERGIHQRETVGRKIGSEQWMTEVIT